MTKQQFRDYCRDRYILLDGATGSNLIKKGMPAGACPEQWILEHTDVFVELQRGYVEAGTDILYAPTFTANRIKLKEYGLEERQASLIRDLVALSRQAAGRRDAGEDMAAIAAAEADRMSTEQRMPLVAGDLTMTGRQLRPMGNMELEELIDIYKEQIQLMEDAGVDLLAVETMMSL